MDDLKTFRKLLSRLTPATSNNEQCVNFVKSYEGDLEVLQNTLIDEINRSSLNGRIKQLNFLEYCAGIVGNCKAQPEWNTLVAQRLQKYVDAAIPIQFSPPSLANVEPTRRFVRGFNKVGLIDSITADRIISQINSKQQNIEALSSLKDSQSHKITREEVLRRMEDDRERAKKYKERELAVVIGSTEEFNSMWESVGPVNGHDFFLIREANSLAGLL